MATVTLTRAQVAGALRAGSEAAAAGHDVRTCPHRTSSSDANERVKASAWLRGYLTAAGKIGPRRG